MAFRGSWQTPTRFTSRPTITIGTSRARCFGASIRALDFHAPGTYAAYAKLSDIKEEAGVPSAEEMIRNLVKGHETVVKTARSLYPVAEDAADEATSDLLTERIESSEKTAWMLRSMLK